MDLITTICIAVSKALRPYSSQIAAGFIATILVVFGNDISGFVKELIKKFNFFIRIVIFVAVCAVGYTLLTDVSTGIIREFLKNLDNRFFGPVVIIAFFGAGIVAERKKYM